MRTPLMKQFTLKKIKRIKGGGLEVAYELMETIGQEIYYDENTIRSSKEPHPDLTSLLNRMAAFTSKIMNLEYSVSMVASKEFNATVGQKDAAETAAMIMRQKVSINGLSISGKEDKKTVKILAVYKPDDLQTLAVNPRVLTDSTKYGFEEEIAEIVNKIEEEAYEYLFNDKKAQLDLFDD